MIATLALSALLAAPPAVETAGDLAVRVLAEPPVVLTVPPATVIDVKDEKLGKLPPFNTDKNAGGWTRGKGLPGVARQETTSRFALDPASVRIKAADGTVFVRGTDYDFDSEWGTVGRLPGGAITANTAVLADYRHGQTRLDAVVLDAAGTPKIIAGPPSMTLAAMPAIPDGSKLLATVWFNGHIVGPGAGAFMLLPVTETAFPEPPQARPTAAEKLLPKTLAKLRSGEKLRFLAWGDSVTACGYIPNDQRWQAQFVARLKERFPKANIELISNGWGGRNTDSFLHEPPGSQFNYAETVLGAKPDLVVSEFVNDAWMDPPTVEQRYNRFLTDFNAIGAEWCILGPHYVRPDWMGLTTERDCDEDPRPYVKGIRAFAAKHNVAMADTSARWGRLWRQGIPYSSYFCNAINHPDGRGMKLFADALMALFPPE